MKYIRRFFETALAVSFFPNLMLVIYLLIIR